jgi:hypothetical protein
MDLVLLDLSALKDEGPKPLAPRSLDADPNAGPKLLFDVDANANALLI